MKETVTTQVSFAARLAGQLLICAKAAALGPAIAMFDIDNGAVPKLLTVTAWVAVGVDKSVDVKLSDRALTLSAGTVGDT